MRLFIAIAFPSEVLAGSAGILKRLQTGCNFVGAHPAWVRPEGLHQTLAFLGEQDADGRERAMAAMREVAAGWGDGIQLSVGGVELFPTARDPRSLALGLHGDVAALAQLQADVVDACRRRGFAIEDRPFRPHVTLARIKSQKGLSGLKGIVASHRALQAGSFRAEEMVLFRSILQPEGARYVAEATTAFTR